MFSILAIIICPNSCNIIRVEMIIKFINEPVNIDIIAKKYTNGFISMYLDKVFII